MSPVPADQLLYDLRDVRRTYAGGGHVVRALDGVSLTVGHGEFVAIVGASGSGKSTLLAILGGLDRPTAGQVMFEGADLSGRGDRDLTALRARDIGFVFQGFNLIPTLSAAQNVESVMGCRQLGSVEQRALALELLGRVGLAARADHLPSRLSGGEQQRVAIARALANGPRVVLADEPTGNLDSATAAEVMDLLRGLGEDLGVTVVLVTHDRDVAVQASRRITMRDGVIVSDDGVRPVGLRLVPAVEPESSAVPVPGLRPLATRLSARLVAQAAVLVSLAGVGAAAVLPEALDAPRGSCTGSCVSAPVAVHLRPQVVPPAAVVTRPTPAAVHVVAPPAPAAPAVLAVRPVVVRRVRPAPVRSPKPVVVPVVKPVSVPVPAKPIVPVVPVEVVTPEPTVTPMPTFNPLQAWTNPLAFLSAMGSWTPVRTPSR